MAKFKQALQCLAEQAYSYSQWVAKHRDGCFNCEKSQECHIIHNTIHDAGAMLTRNPDGRVR
jgi:hypothetical protein